MQAQRIRSNAHRIGVALGALALMARPGSAAAQSAPPDTVTTSGQRTVEVARRAPSTVAGSGAAVSVVSLRPVVGVADTHLSEALRLVPGVTTVDFDAIGHDPTLLVRGFHAGRSAEHVTFLLDGMPIDDPWTGGIVWDLIPTVALSEIHILRGPAASLYGPGAVAGVVDLVPAGTDVGDHFDFRAGSPQTVHGSARGGGELFGLDADIYGSARYLEGFRNNESRIVFNGGSTLEVVADADRDLTLSVLGMWRDVDRPGPLPGDEVDDDPQSIEVFYSFDGTQEWVTRADLEGEIRWSPRSRLSVALAGEARRRDEIRTVQPSLDQGDTRERIANSRRLLATTRLERTDLGLPWSDRLLVGVDASLTGLDSEVRDVVSGGRVTYVFSDPTRPVVATGQGGRTTAAGYLRYEVRPVDALRIAVGGRADWLRDTFEAGDPAPGPETTATHSAFTPEVGVDLGWLSSDRHTGHLFAKLTRTVRAPTPQELFDQRAVPIVGSNVAAISNPLLDPERGSSVEVGAYHDLALVPNRWSLDASVALYRIEMEDEIAFDPGTFMYGNVAESRHDGAEVGLGVRGPSSSRVFLNYSLQDVTARAGANTGNALPIVPRHLFSAGVSLRPADVVEVGAHVARHGGAWLDSENTVRLDGYTRVDTFGTVRLIGLDLLVNVLDLFDGRYAPVGFLDPGGTGTPMLFPSAGRLIEVGFRARN